jgi:hypothetical protein
MLYEAPLGNVPPIRSPSSLDLLLRCLRARPENASYVRNLTQIALFSCRLHPRWVRNNWVRSPANVGDTVSLLDWLKELFSLCPNVEHVALNLFEENTAATLPSLLSGLQRLRNLEIDVPSALTSGSTFDVFSAWMAA